MAHSEQLLFFSLVRDRFPESFRSCRVLEVGSWDKNGSVRALFDGCNYLGIDVGPGPGVDFVCPGQDLDLPAETFDTVISGECFEHNLYWFETFANMVRLLKADGLCAITCATVGRTEHGTRRMMADSSLTSLLSRPDYYRNLRARDFTSRMRLHEHFAAWAFITNVYHRDLYFLGVKAGPGAATSASRVAAVAENARRISPSPRPASLAVIATRCSFAARYCLSRLLGEHIYHNAEFHIRSLLNRVRPPQ